LGYDVAPRGARLEVNRPEAAGVREIFALYLQHGGLLGVVQELERRGWKTKRWRTRKGHERGGKPFTKSSLHHLLTNVVYRGKVRYKDEVHPGEHEAIVDSQVWRDVQALLRQQSPGSNRRNGSGALLKGLVYCQPCGRAMTPTYACKPGGRRYCYYTCTGALSRGRRSCPSGSLPAGFLEEWVLGQLQERTRILSEHSKPVPKGSSTSANAPPNPSEPLAELVHRWLERVDYDGTKQKLSLTFRSAVRSAQRADRADDSKEQSEP
jgi:site-specific DNA recombinase